MKLFVFAALAEKKIRKKRAIFFKSFPVGFSETGAMPYNPNNRNFPRQVLSISIYAGFALHGMRPGGSPARERRQSSLP